MITLFMNNPRVIKVIPMIQYFFDNCLVNFSIILESTVILKTATAMLAVIKNFLHSCNMPNVLFSKLIDLKKFRSEPWSYPLCLGFYGLTKHARTDRRQT